MEIFLHLWDELDDLAGACRHIATSTAVEATALVRARAAKALVTILGALALRWPPR